MRKIKIVISALILLGIGANLYASAHTTPYAATEGDSVENSYESIVYKPTEYEEIVALPSLDFTPKLAQCGTQMNQILLFNPTTGDVVATHDFGAYERIFGTIDLGNGYYAIHVGENDLFSHLLWNGMLDYIWEMEDEEANAYIKENFPEVSESERNFRVVIFDQHLNIVETLPGETEENGLSLWGSVATFIDGMFTIYDTKSIPGEVGESFGAFAIIPAHVRRHNLSTGDIDILFEVPNSMNFVEFIGDRYILVQRVVDGSGGQREAVLNLETGELIDLGHTVRLEGDDVVSHLESLEINLEAWVSFGNSLEELDTFVWDNKLLEYFGINFDSCEYAEILWGRGFTPSFDGTYFFSDPGLFNEIIE